MVGNIIGGYIFGMVVVGGMWMAWLHEEKSDVPVAARLVAALFWPAVIIWGLYSGTRYWWRAMRLGFVYWQSKFRQEKGKPPAQGPFR